MEFQEAINNLSVELQKEIVKMYDEIHLGKNGTQNLIMVRNQMKIIEYYARIQFSIENIDESVKHLLNDVERSKISTRKYTRKSK